jgi:methylisocitrate lyase
MSRSARFRELLKSPPFVCLGAHDAVTAKPPSTPARPRFVSGFVAGDRRGRPTSAY